MGYDNEELVNAVIACFWFNSMTDSVALPIRVRDLIVGTTGTLPELYLHNGSYVVRYAHTMVVFTWEFRNYEHYKLHVEIHNTEKK